MQLDKLHRKIVLIFGLLSTSSVYALINSHTIILQTERANLEGIIPLVKCIEPLKIEIVSENNHTWRVFYATPERLTSCEIIFTYKFGNVNACVYDADLGFEIGHGSKQSDEWSMYGTRAASLNPVSLPLPYCPGEVGISIPYPDKNQEGITNIYL